MGAPETSVRSRSSWRAVVALLCVTVVWGGTFVWMKQGLSAVERAVGAGHETLGVALFMVLRFGIAALCMAVFVPSARTGATRDAWRGGFWIGALLFVGFALQMLGLTEVTPAVSAFLTSLYVLFTAVLTASMERRGPSLALFVGVLLATVGAGFIRGRPELSFNVGEWLTVGCAVLFALHILATDRITKRVAPMPVTLTSFVWVTIGGALLIGTALLSGPPVDAGKLLGLMAESDFMLPVVLSSVLATVLALSLMNVYQRQLDPVRAAVLYAIEPIWAALFGIWYGTDAFTPYLWLGGTLLLAGNLVAELGQRRRLRDVAQA